MRNRCTLRHVAFAFFTAVILSLSSGAQAQSEKPLYNIKELGFDSFGYDADSIACGVSDSVVKTATSVYAKYLPFKIVDTVEKRYLILFMIETFRTKDRCITHIYLQVSYSMVARLPNAKEDDLARIELWSKTNFVVTEPDPKAHRVGVGKTLIDQLKEMADTWHEQNATRL